MGCESSKSQSGGGGGGASQSTPSLVRDAGKKSGPDTYKVVLLGDKAVGKSSLVLRYTQDKFSETHAITIGAAFVSKDVSVGGRPVRLHIWDTAGEEAYRSMTRFFYRDAAAGMVVYDLTQPDSFQHVNEWIRDFREQCPDAAVVLVGNKCDMPERRAVGADSIAAYAAAQSLATVECSAKTNERVAEAFHLVASQLDSRARQSQAAAAPRR